jgi:putative DNA primase/helicase
MSDEQSTTDAMVEPGEFLRLFPCDVAAYGRPTGERKNDKEVWNYAFKHRKPEAQDVESHYAGLVSIVANPVVRMPAKGTERPMAKWGSIDSDNYDPIFQASLRNKVRELMPFAMTVPSKSGGLHVFVLFKSWIPFAQAKALLDGWVALLGLPPKTEIFPSQPWAKADKGLGINLPGFGTGLRRDEVKTHHVEPWAWDAASSSSERAASASGEGEAKRRPTADGFDLGEFLNFYGLKFQKRGDAYGLDACPLCDGGPRPHTQHNESTTVIWWDGKGMGAKCQADSHRELGATDMVDALLARKPWDKPVWKSKDYAKTDTGNAERFADEHKDEFRFIEDKKIWVSWDGSRWSKDSMWKVHQAGKDTIRRMYQEALEVDDDDRRKKLISWAMSSEMQRGRNAIVSLAEKEEDIVAKSETFDRDPFLLNVANGTLDLRPKFGKSGLSLHPVFRAARKEDMMTKSSPVAYDPSADCPRFKQFLQEMFADYKDQDKAEAIHSLQRAFAYSMLGTADEQCFFLLWGPGENGKSLLLRVIAHVLGDYAEGTSFDVFLAKRSESKAIDPRSGLFELLGSRYVFASESDQGSRFSEALIKAITGGEELKVAQMYQEAVTFKPGFKLWLSTNHEPYVRGTDNGIWRRIKKFEITAVPQNKDKYLFDKLAAESSGILNWLCEGLMLYHAEAPVGGLQIPKLSDDAVEKYRADQNAVLRFITAACLPTTDDREATPARAMYEAYKTWCKQSGEYELAERLFAPEMEKLAEGHGFKRKAFSSGPHKAKMGYFGLKVNLDLFNE